MFKDIYEGMIIMNRFLYDFYLDGRIIEEIVINELFFLNEMV